MTKILFISYHFPPHGGAGVQRALKFVKYLPDFEIQPIVLTDKSHVEGKWTPRDPSLLDDLRSDAIVYREQWPTAGGQDSDARNAFKGDLLRRAVEIGQAESVKAVFVTMSPFEDAELASGVSEALGVPWIADLRDPWALDEFQTYRTGLHRWRAGKLMRRALQSASCVIMNTPEAVSRLQKTFPEFAQKKTTYITNGFDHDDFLNAARDSEALLINSDKCNIVHTGACHTGLGLRQKRLSFINRALRRTWPGVEALPRSPYYLFQALCQLRKTDPATFRDLNVILVGILDEVDRDLIRQLELHDTVICTGYVAHTTSIRYLLKADLLFLPMHHVATADRATIVPGKTYEYIASCKPILAAVPDGDARSILLQAGGSIICDPKDAHAIAESLRVMRQRWKDGALYSDRDSQFVAQFDRRKLAARLAEVIKYVAER